jgi:formylglycine-generating enzyme
MARKSIARTVGPLLVVGAMALLGCEDKSAIAPEPGASGGTTGITAKDSGATAGSGGVTAKDSGPAELACPSGTAGAQQILIPLADGTGYCIDQLEATRRDYKAFLDAKAGDVSGQPPECAKNDSYEPPGEDPANPERTGACVEFSFEKDPDYPAGCVDFCDAFAYCAWAGKRLCGKIGATEKGVQKMDLATAVQVAGTTAGEWSYACSQGGKTAYPYGDTYEPATCIDKTRVDQQGPSARLATIEGETCHGSEPPFDQIYHLSGSVTEWLNLCDMSLKSCASQPTPDYACTASGLGYIYTRTAGIGFRCCADAVAVPAGQ